MSRNLFARTAAQTINPDTIDVWTPLGYFPSPKQLEFHQRSQERVHAILLGGAAGGGKLLDIRTPIPTPDRGFVNLRDVHPGDSIFGSDGLIYPVLAESAVETVPGYRLTLDDGSTVDAHDDHLWLTFSTKERERILRRDPEWRARRRSTRPTRGISGKKSEKFSDSLTARNTQRALDHEGAQVTGTVRTTAEIVATLESRPGRKNHAIPVCAPVQMPDAELPIDPYVLGAWLGDGTSTSGAITSMDDEIVDQVEEAGFVISSIQTKPGNRAQTYLFERLTTLLRVVGVFNHKHIPQQYLWGSESQRLALLQGLMDTDGTCNLDGGCEFSSTLQPLAEGVAFLARSLGIKATVREGRSTLYGKDCGPKWTVLFTTTTPVFRLQRKLERLPKATRQTQEFRYIVNAERLPESVEMKCLRVGSPDNLFLVSEHFIATHNSCALLMEAIHCAANFPGMRIGCFRRTYPELEESFIGPLGQRWGYARALEPVLGSMPKWIESKYILRFPNGSVINFTYAETPKDASRILGGEYQLFCIDECTLTEKQTLEHIEERLRSGRRDLPVIGARYSSNPGGISQTYFKKRFVDATERGRKGIVHDENDLTVCYIPAGLKDNPHLGPEYEKILKAIPDPVRRRQMLEGDWSVTAGSFFEQWSDERHVIRREDSDSWVIPKEWPRYCGIDYGIRDPWAVIWGAVDPDGRVWLYREIYTPGVDVYQQPKLILEAEANNDEEHVIRFADPSIWGNMGTNVSIADIYGHSGCALIPADNHRPNGWTKVHHYLNESVPPCFIHREKGWKNCPLLHVLEGRCPMVIETVPALPRDDLKTDDAKTRGVADHLPDALRYMCSGIGAHAAPVFYDDISETLQGLNPTPKPGPALQIIEPGQPAVPLVGGMFGGDISIPKKW